MVAWWDSLDNFVKVLYCIAIPSTIILVIQTILIIIGFDGGDGIDISDTSGLDLGGDIGVDGIDINGVDIDVNLHDIDLTNHNIDQQIHENMTDVSDFRLFTLQGIIAFFCVFGWTSIGGVNGGMNKVLAVLLGIVFGFIVLFLIAKLIHWSRHLVQSGTMDIRNAIGERGEVYLIIPSKGNGHGKVNVTIQGRMTDFDAITEEDKCINTGEFVRITDIKGDTLVVERD